MSETNNTVGERRTNIGSPGDEQISVLFVNLRSDGSDSVQSALEAEYGIRVRTVSSVQSAFVRLNRNCDSIDCAVLAGTEEGSVELDALEKARTRGYDLPILVYAAPGCGPDRCEAYIRTGATDVVTRTAETDRLPVLAHRIERCVSRGRETGEVRRTDVVTDGVSDRKRYRRRLETAQRKYEALIDAAPDAIFVADADSGEIIEANEAASNLLSRPREEIIGMAHTELHPPEHRGRYRRLFEYHSNVGEGIFDRFDSGEPVHVVTAGGERIPVEVSATVVELDGRKLVQGHFRDTSERRRRERDLRSYREAVEQAGHAIMITDTDGTIEYVNPRFEEVTGYSETEALGERPSILKSGEHGEAFYRNLWETITSGEVWQGELVNRRKDGERYYIDQTIAPITDGEGTIERFVAINADITERKRYESQLERERDRLGEFAGTVAHDLRNPLMIASGHIGLARERQPRADISVKLDTAMTALRRMEAVIDEVLTLSERGATIREPEPVDLPRIAEKAWSLVETASATLSVDEGLSERPVRADESRLCQAFENLFRNAVEYAGPDVTVTVGRLPERDGFYVEDDGPGLPPKDRNRVFESGFTTSDDGTGFGLAIVKQIVEAHGWAIAATDAAGDRGGARFEITGITNR